MVSVGFSPAHQSGKQTSAAYPRPRPLCAQLHIGLLAGSHSPRIEAYQGAGQPLGAL